MNPVPSAPIPLSIAVFIEGAFIERVITSAPVQVASLDLDVEGTTSENVVPVPAGLEFAGDSAILSVDQGRADPLYTRSLFLAMPHDNAPETPAPGPMARRLLLTVKHGEVQSCLSDGDVRVLVLNRDTEGLDLDDLMTFPHENMLRKGTFDSEASWLTSTVAPETLDAAWNQLGSSRPGPLPARRRPSP